MSSLNPLRQLLELDPPSKFPDQFDTILRGKEYQQWVQVMQDDDVVKLVNCLDRALDVLDPASPSFRKCMRELRQICCTKTIFPSSHTFSPQDLNTGDRPFTSGGFSDVYEGALRGAKVCVKRIRVYPNSNPIRQAKAFYREAVVWKRLEHKNVVPFLGITTTPLQLILVWIPGGELIEYIRKDPGVDRVGLVSDVAEGLDFLHFLNIVHGDLKGPNILIDDTGHARITDFGFATLAIGDPDSTRSTLEVGGFSVRWAAPEILKGNEHSKEADVFSFAMIMIEAFTGTVPFSDRLSTAIIQSVIDGKRPPRPTHPTFTDDLWTLMQQCWGQDPRSRPEVSKILKILGATELLPTMSPNYQVDSSSTPTREYSPLPVRARASRSVVECRRDSIHPPVKVDSPAGAQPLPPPSMSVSDVDRTGYPRNFSPTIRSSRRRGLLGHLLFSCCR